MSPRLSAVVITRDEEDRLDDCLKSLAWVDEIVVVDSGSTDRTVEIARRYTERVHVREWKGYAAQRNEAGGLATGEWVLSLDADERVTEGLRREIEAALARPDSELPDGFLVPRLTFHLGRWIRRGGWYPDLKLRLVRRGRGRCVGGAVHERCVVEGRTERLREPVLHFTYRDLSDHLRRIDTYAGLWARERYDRGERAGLGGLALRPFLKFVRMYLLKGGLLEGRAGLILASMGAWYVFLRYARLWEMHNRQARGAA